MLIEAGVKWLDYRSCPVNPDVMLRGVARTVEAVNTLPWLERWMLDVGLKSDFSDEKWNGLIKSAVFAGVKA